jgi:hypothetical protein
MDAAPVVPQPVASAGLTGTARIGGPVGRRPPRRIPPGRNVAPGKINTRFSHKATKPRRFLKQRITPITRIFASFASFAVQEERFLSPERSSLCSSCLCVNTLFELRPEAGGNKNPQEINASFSHETTKPRRLDGKGLSADYTDSRGNNLRESADCRAALAMTWSADSIIPGCALLGAVCGAREEIIGLAGGGWPMKKGTQHSDAPGGCHGARPRSAGIVRPERSRGEARETVEGARYGWRMSAKWLGVPATRAGEARTAPERGQDARDTDAAPADTAGPARRGGEIPLEKKDFQVRRTRSSRRASLC